MKRMLCLSVLATTILVCVPVTTANAQRYPTVRETPTSTQQVLQRLKRSLHPCLVELIQRESQWNHLVYNRQGSGAYGLPQALPGHKMASEGADWRTNPVTQARWMQKYVLVRYGGPCQALYFQKSRGWY